MFDTPPKIVLWATVMVLLAGCARASNSTSTETVPLYLEEVVPPCVPTESEPDPCPPDLPAPIVESNRQGLTAVAMLEVPSFAERLLWDSDVDGTVSVHIVVRGTVKTNTTRCDIYNAKVADYVVKEYKIVRVVDQYLVDFSDYSCFAEVAVKEYIVGEGPPTLTVITYQRGFHKSSLDPEGKLSDSQLEYYDLKTKAIAYEGREIIFLLGPAPSIEVEAWAGLGGGNMWFLQQTEDGIRAIAENYPYAVLEEHRQKLNLPLDKLIEDIKQAAKNRDSLTDGRIGIDPNLPMYITDANHLRDHYIAVGAVYDATDRATKLPPPVPGEGDPPAPTIPTNEGTTGTTVPAPGEEPTLPPPTDDAGLSVGQETTTTTGTTTTTTTAVDDTSTTTEVAPIVSTTTEPVGTTTTTEATATEPVTGTTTTTASTTTTTEPLGGESDTPTVNADPSEEEPTTTDTPETGEVEISEETTTTALPAGDGIPPTEGNEPGGEPEPANPVDESEN